MAVAYASSSFTTPAAGDPVVTKPTGLAVGDLLVGVVAGDVNVDILSLPSGFTVLDSAVNAANGVYLKYGYKVATSGDVAATNFTFGGGGAGVAGAGLVRVTGPSSNFFSAAAAGTASSYGNSITPNIPDSLLLFFVAGSDQGNATRTVSGYAIATDNPSWTEIGDVSSVTSDDLTLACAYASRPQTTATGNSSFTPSGTMSTTAVGMMAIAPIQAASVSPAVLSVVASVQAPSIVGTASMSAAVITVSVAVQAPTVTIPAPTWTNSDKSSSPSWTNPDKS